MPFSRKRLTAAVAIAITTFAALPDYVGLTDRAAAQNGDEPKIVELDLKKGMWEVEVHTSNIDVNYDKSEAALQPLMQNYTAEQRAKMMADVKKDEAKKIASRAKGSDNKSRKCPLNQGFISKVNATGKDCTRHVTSTPQQLVLQVSCHADDGGQGYEQISKFTRIDAETFQGTMVVKSHVGEIGTIAQTYTGKWIADTCAGPAAGYAAKNGLHPKGPADVARDDPNRVVAVIDGKEITAQQGWNMIQKVPPPTRNSYKGGLSALLERVYLQNAVADEAMKLKLDKQKPWKDKLAHAKQVDLQVHQNYAGDPNIPPEVWANWINDQQHILWNAYFSQGPAKGDDDARLLKEKEKYKITVKDPDFFAGGS